MVIAEYCKVASNDSFRVILREDNYDSRLSKFLELFEAAKSDFPFISESDINLVHYGGDRYKRTFGLEFSVPDSTSIPDIYVEIHSLEMTL